jgi:hypothetical protein
MAVNTACILVLIDADKELQANDQELISCSLLMPSRLILLLLCNVASQSTTESIPVPSFREVKTLEIHTVNYDIS